MLNTQVLLGSVDRNNNCYQLKLLYDDVQVHQNVSTYDMLIHFTGLLLCSSILADPSIQQHVQICLSTCTHFLMCVCKGNVYCLSCVDLNFH